MIRQLNRNLKFNFTTKMNIDHCIYDGNLVAKTREKKQKITGEHCSLDLQCATSDKRNGIMVYR